MRPLTSDQIEYALPLVVHIDVCLEEAACALACMWGLALLVGMLTQWGLGVMELHGGTCKNVNVKCAIPREECRRGAHLPFLGLEPAGVVGN